MRFNKAARDWTDAEHWRSLLICKTEETAVYVEVENQLEKSDGGNSRLK